MGKPEGKRPLSNPRNSCEDNMKMDLQDVGWRGTDWIYLAQYSDSWRTLVNAAINFRAQINLQSTA
jgi:hypothetical protein